MLTLSDLDARTAQGRLAGALSLDGRQPQAVWKADLDLIGVRLERWLHQDRPDDAPPYVTGQLDGQVQVTGNGRSTAEILGSLDGGIRFHVRNGSLSHLALEAGRDRHRAGARHDRQGRRRADDPVQRRRSGRSPRASRRRASSSSTRAIRQSGSTARCRCRPRRLDLRAVVSPKDFSPFTVRTPIHVRGTFSDPRRVGGGRQSIGAKLGAAALLALITPLAAVIPFVDPGARDEAQTRRSPVRRVGVARQCREAVVRPEAGAATATVGATLRSTWFGSASLQRAMRNSGSVQTFEGDNHVIPHQVHAPGRTGLQCAGRRLRAARCQHEQRRLQGREGSHRGRVQGAEGQLRQAEGQREGRLSRGGEGQGEGRPRRARVQSHRRSEGLGQARDGEGRCRLRGRQGDAATIDRATTRTSA